MRDGEQYPNRLVILDFLARRFVRDTFTAAATLVKVFLPTITPHCSIGPNQTVCPGTNATFAATPGFSSYLWSNGATTNNVTVSASGTYGGL
ncbi:MAG: hypothetical protein IPN95_28060 [Bacteroidetes bacterium]|nr:hypothetical protein [Bacteroidota bacterium]